MAILDQWWTSLTAYPNIVGLTVGTTLINGSLQTTVFWNCLKICLLYIRSVETRAIQDMDYIRHLVDTF